MNEELPTAPLNNLENIKGLIDQLQDSLRNNLPNYEFMLATIHKAIQKDEELCHILTDDQIGVICAGLQKKTGVIIATTSSKSTGAKGKSLKDTTLDDV